MNPEAEKPSRHPVTFCWPPFLAIVPFIIGDFLGATQTEAFRHTSNVYQPFSFDDFARPQPQPRDRRAPPLLGGPALYVVPDTQDTT